MSRPSQLDLIDSTPMGLWAGKDPSEPQDEPLPPTGELTRWANVPMPGEPWGRKAAIEPQDKPEVWSGSEAEGVTVFQSDLLPETSSRQRLIDRGKLWQVYPDGSPDDVLFEGNKTQCKQYIWQEQLQGQWRRGSIRMGQVIWEASNG